ncbi:MAG: hypothetical protein M3550_02040 [Actinomycetota bacterium]|nr:hypothetical protein [Actinomycetota bacterium]
MLLLLAATTAGVALMSVTAADANARTYVGQPAGGGRIAIKIDGGRVRQVEASIPASCESNNGQHWRTTLVVNVSGNLPLRSGRFRIQGQAPNGVRGDLRGRLRSGRISGRVRLTFLDLDYVGPSDDSYLCDTGTRPFRAD